MSDEMSGFGMRCDWCGTPTAIVELEVVVMRLDDGNLEPEAWCPECQAEARRQDALR